MLESVRHRRKNERVFGRLLGRRLLMIPVGQIEEIVPEQKRTLLQSPKTKALASSSSVTKVGCVTDDEFLDAFFGGRLGAAEFRHGDHLRLAWLMVRRCGLDGGGDRVVEGIKRFAAAQGVADRYHETITRFWLRLVAHAIGVRPEMDDFERFLEAFPLLLDGSLPRRHWSEEPLEHGRRAWREPDLAPLP